MDASNDVDTYFNEYGSQIDCTQTEKSFAVEDDIIIPDPQGLLFGNTPHLNNLLALKVEMFAKNANSVDVEDKAISDIEVSEIPSEFHKEKWGRKWKYLKTL